MRYYKKLPATLVTCVLMGAIGGAGAGDHDYGPYPAYYTEECGSCHVPIRLSE